MGGQDGAEVILRTRHEAPSDWTIGVAPVWRSGRSKRRGQPELKQDSAAADTTAQRPVQVARSTGTHAGQRGGERCRAAAGPSGEANRKLGRTARRRTLPRSGRSK